MKITVIGTGYVGLVSGICFAKLGHEVICVDKDSYKVESLKKNIIPIYEPGLTELLQEVVAAKKISFTTDLNQALQGAKAVFIAVGTPQDEDGSADLSYVIAAAKEIAQFSKEYKLVVTKSTVPVGTSVKVYDAIAKTNPQLEFNVASNPEFLREGNAIEDFMDPDRIVVGSNDEKSRQILVEIYEKFPRKKVIHTDITTAELIKYAANSFLATKISFINEMADLCEKVGGNIRQLSYAIGLDSRIGEKFLNPGPGFGGSCFPKDIMAVVNVAKENNVELSLINSVIASNALRKERMVDKIAQALGGLVSGKKIALLGLAFKGNTDDIRYSPAITIAKALAQKSALIRATDFQAIANAKKELSEVHNIEFFADVYEAIAGADLIVIATEWKEYGALDLERVKKITVTRKIVDLRNMLDADKVRSAGFEYSCIGQK